MIHFTKTKKGHILVTAVASNGRKLFPADSYTQKPSAWTNVKSILKMFGGKSVFVQDNTVTPALVYKVSGNNVTKTNQKPTKKIP